MIEWVANYFGTIVIALILSGVVCAVTIKLCKDKKEGKTSCGCGCENCAMSGICCKNKEV